uniref:Uncharacterized protein n=1 Tax=Globodera pallida TaxID=36090 RepID=A0A183CJB5_GLOPA
MSEQHKLVDKREAKRRKRKEERRSSGQHMQKVISEEKLYVQSHRGMGPDVTLRNCVSGGAGPTMLILHRSKWWASCAVQTSKTTVDRGMQTEPQRVDVGVQVLTKRCEAGTQTSGGPNALSQARSKIELLRARLIEMTTRNEELEQNLTTKTANTRQKSARQPRKALENITPRQLRNRSKTIADVFRSCSPGSPGSPASRSLFLQARRALGVTSPSKKVPNLSVEQDVNLTIRSGISFSARRMIKQRMLTMGIDCWTATSAVDQMKAAFGTAQTFEWQGTAADGALFCTNIAETVRRRVDMLAR